MYLPAGGDPPGLGRLTCGLGLEPPASPIGDNDLFCGTGLSNIACLSHR